MTENYWAVRARRMLRVTSGVVLTLAITSCRSAGSQGRLPSPQLLGPRLTSPVNVSVGLSTDCPVLRVGEPGTIHVDLVGDMSGVKISWIVDGQVDTRDTQNTFETTGSIPSGYGRLLRAQLTFVPTHVGEVVSIALSNSRTPAGEPDTTQVVGTDHPCQVIDRGR